ncbi:hypothetical protein [Paraburkholderia sediminicola]|uniref:hypothetical protein n=1 Tax=Paraburkholderia sediminicola TaxID=458836 RepID=UPI0038B8F062
MIIIQHEESAVESMVPVVISTNEVKCFWPQGFVVCLYVKRRAARKAKAKYESVSPCDSGHGLTNQFDELVAEPRCSLPNQIFSIRNCCAVVDGEPLLLENKLEIVVNECDLR